MGGVDVGSSPEAVKQRIGYMSQRFSLYEKLTVDQNISFFGGIYGLDRERLEARRAAAPITWGKRSPMSSASGRGSLAPTPACARVSATSAARTEKRGPMRLGM